MQELCLSKDYIYPRVKTEVNVSATVGGNVCNSGGNVRNSGGIEYDVGNLTAVIHNFTLITSEATWNIM